MGSSEFDLDNIFREHELTPEQSAQCGAVREAAKEFAKVVLANTPPSADQSTAVRRIREAVMTANAAIALDGLLYKE